MSSEADLDLWQFQVNNPVDPGRRFLTNVAPVLVWHHWSGHLARIGSISMSR